MAAFPLLKPINMLERTLIIIKPDAIKRELIGEILLRFENAGLHVLAMKMVQVSKRDAEKFYAEHAGKSFFEKLTTLLSSTPIIPVVLSGENAIAHVRKIMGATNPVDAEEGTIRHDLALDGTQNSVHGSDSPDSAAREIAFFFNTLEIFENREG
ncbi:nucleoside diphosphate kinase [Candidatus Vecturithrix granuli]|uniref:Nucleoside diphosphate kinase n=1 Tax=Vecturithrix granuli TaxID=1499967 RepID=A0A081BYA6_VECG1|nr:nucleoside diphosphate kinase [Candidatus Vecturithrix granuli]